MLCFTAASCAGALKRFLQQSTTEDQRHKLQYKTPDQAGGCRRSFSGSFVRPSFKAPQLTSGATVGAECIFSQDLLHIVVINHPCDENFIRRKNLSSERDSICIIHVSSSLLESSSLQIYSSSRCGDGCEKIFEEGKHSPLLQLAFEVTRRTKANRRSQFNPR